MATTEQQQLPDLSPEMRQRVRQVARLMKSFQFPAVADTILMLDEALTVRERQLARARDLLDLAVDSSVARSSDGVILCAYCTAELCEVDLEGEHADDCWVGKVQAFIRDLDDTLPDQ